MENPSGDIVFYGLRLLLMSILIQVQLASAQPTRIDLEAHYYEQKVANNLNGPAYVIREPYAVQSQFYNDHDPVVGTLVYDGVRYESIVLQFDLVLQTVVILLVDGDGSQFISLDREKVNYFEIDNDEFVLLPANGVITHGLYRQAFSSSGANLFVKHQKNRVRKIEETLKIEYVPKTTYYVSNSNGAFEVKDKKSFLRAFGNSDSIKQLVKDLGLKFSKYRLERDLITILPRINRDTFN